MLKVAHIVTIYRGAVGILEAKLVALDSYDDLDITIITPPPPKNLDLPSSVVRQISTPMVRPIRPLADLWSLWKMYRLLRREKFDIVHTHSSKAGVIGAIAAWLTKTPLILHTYHGLSFFDGQNKLVFHIYRILEKFTCCFRDHVFSQNYRDIPACIKLMGSNEKVSYEGNGVNIAWVQAKAKKNIERAEKDFPPGKLRITLVSRLEPVKRVDDFLDMCKILADSKVDFSAIIAGYGPLETKLKEKMDELGLINRIHLLGWADYAVALMAISDIVVLTSEKEGIPRALIEAMALGKPVIATDVLGTQELVVDGETGFLTPLGNPKAMADKITLLVNDPKLSKNFSHAATERVQEHFNDLKIAEFLHNFYAEKYIKS